MDLSEKKLAKKAYKAASKAAKRADDFEDAKSDSKAVDPESRPKKSRDKAKPASPSRHPTLSLLQLLQRPMGSAVIARRLLLRAPPSLRALVLGAVTLGWYYAHNALRIELYAKSGMWNGLSGGEKMLASLQLGWARAGFEAGGAGDAMLAELGEFFAAAWDEGRDVVSVSENPTKSIKSSAAAASTTATTTTTGMVVVDEKGEAEVAVA